MIRPLVAGLFAAGIALCTGLPGATAQPKKKERVAFADPKAVAQDPDFAIQGEYEGEGNYGEAKPRKFGIQLVARGGGQFAGKLYQGGLPGAGWDGKQPMAFAAERTGEGKAALKSEKGPVIGELADGVAKLTGAAPIACKKVERKSKTLGQKPPEGAVVLFGNPDDVKKWDGGKVTELSDGKFLGVGEKSKEKFGAFKAHIEFRLPWMPNSTGQGRGNSGVYLQDRYEVQVLDSFGLKGENNECGGIYTQHKPSVNMCLPPMQWQTYDIEFTPAHFENGKKAKNARATIYHNGVKIHDDVEFPKECPGGQKETADPGPFQLQNHGDPVVYRNIWVVPVK